MHTTRFPIWGDGLEPLSCLVTGWDAIPGECALSLKEEGDLQELSWVGSQQAHFFLDGITHFCVQHRAPWARS